MTISFNQPAFIPWGGFFSRLMFSDLMLLLDNTLFAQGFTFVNRNRIKCADGELWVTVPVARIHGHRQQICELQIKEKSYWGDKWLETLRHAYSRSLGYEDFTSRMVSILGETESDFVPFVLSILEMQRTFLSIDSPFVLQSDLGADGRGVELLLNCCRKLKASRILLPHHAARSLNWRYLKKEGLEVLFLHFRSPVYPQFWGSHLANLSFLDMQLCAAEQSATLLRRASRVESGS